MTAQPGPDFLDGLKVQEAIEAAYISAREGRWVSLPLPE